MSSLPPLSTVSQIVLVLSGKGGVGKSSTTVQLALALTLQGHSVGILDIDLTGPSIPRLLGIEDAKITQTREGWSPVCVYGASKGGEPAGVGTEAAEVPEAAETEADTEAAPTATPTQPARHGPLHALSLALLLPSRSSAVIWRGPKKTAMIRQFLADVAWPKTDFLLVDTPPGTSDEHIALLEELGKITTVTDQGKQAQGQAQPKGPRLAGAIVVTTPQAVATADVRKELDFCVKTHTPVLGVLENMAGYVCPCCGEVSNVFSKGGGEIMAKECGVAFWGSIPLDTGWGKVVDSDGGGKVAAAKGEDKGKGLLQRYTECRLMPIFEGVAKRLLGEVDVDTG